MRWPSRSEVAWPLIGGLGLLGGWYALIALAQLPPYLLPPPHGIAASLVEEAPTIAPAAGRTFLAALLGLLGATTLGAGLALAMSWLRPLRLALYPYVILMQMVPILATAALLVVWLDVGLGTVALIAFLISFFPIVANTTQGLSAVPAAHQELFALYRARPWQRLLWLQVPHALPYFFAGLKIAATLVVIGSVTGEIFAGDSTGGGGLGWLILFYKSRFQTDALLASVLVCCALGFVFVGGVQLLRWACLRHWQEATYMPE